MQIIQKTWMLVMVGFKIVLNRSGNQHTKDKHAKNGYKEFLVGMILELVHFPYIT